MYRNTLVILFGILSSIQLVNSRGGTIELLFIKYTNPGGLGSNDNCCEGILGICTGSCDHNFHICLDTQTGTRHMTKCPYGTKTSGVISNQNTNVFTKKVGNLDNPMKFKFTQSWPGGIKVKINIHDEDDVNSHDHVDYLSKDFTSRPKIYTQANQGWVDFNINGEHNTVLNAKIRVYCDINYYDANCDTFCKPGNSAADGFYTCDPNTGEMVCKKGWMGRYCKESTDPCYNKPCKDFEICNITGTSTYECVCPSGKTGSFCNESDVMRCTDNSCQKGGSCSVSGGAITCTCSHLWTGSMCEVYLDPCNTTICKNNATCNVTDSGNVTCTCQEGWTGEYCETEYNLCTMCLHNSSCSTTGRENITCTCAEGWTGHYCETRYNPCDNEICQNNGTCNVTDSGFECLCTEYFTGINCESFRNMTTTTVTANTSTGTTQSPEDTTQKSPSVVIKFIGLVQNNEELGKEFKKLIYELTDAKGDLAIHYKKEYPKPLEGEPITKVSFRVFEDGKDINDKLIRVLSETDYEIIDEYFTLKVYQEQHVNTPQKLEHTGFIHSHWYVILIIILAIIILLVVMGVVLAHFKRKRTQKQRQKEYISRQSSTVSDALPAQSFENSLYFEMNQPYKKGPQAGTSGQ